MYFPRNVYAIILFCLLIICTGNIAIPNTNVDTFIFGMDVPYDGPIINSGRALYLRLENPGTLPLKYKKLIDFIKNDSKYSSALSDYKSEDIMILNSARKRFSKGILKAILNDPDRQFRIIFKLDDINQEAVVQKKNLSWDDSQPKEINQAYRNYTAVELRYLYRNWDDFEKTKLITFTESDKIMAPPWIFASKTWDSYKRKKNISL